MNSTAMPTDMMSDTTGMAESLIPTRPIVPPISTAVCADSAGGIALGGAMCMTRGDPLIGAALFRRAEHHRHALTIRIEDLSVGSTRQHET